MTVAVSSLHRSLTSRPLLPLLQHCQQVALAQGQPQIITLSRRIAPLDPYVVLPHLTDPTEPQVSFGRSPHHPEGLGWVAGGALQQVTLQGHSRFAEANPIVRQILGRCHSWGDVDHPLARPRIWCSFSFFPTVPVGSPFPAATLLLPRWLIGHQGGDWIAVVNHPITPETDLQNLMAQICRQFHQITAPRLGAPQHGPIHPLHPASPYPDPGPLRQAIDSVLQAIHRHQVQKVVLAQTRSIPLSHPLPLAPLLRQLHQIYPECTVFSFSLGEGSTFLGASPERLVSLRRGCFLIDALAGSVPRGLTPAQDHQLGQQVLASAKDRDEHDLVVTGILRQLARLGLKGSFPAVPHLLKLSTIQHLHTPIQGCVSQDLTALDLVAALHPTPAVAGTPTDLACDLIRRWEGFDRSLYAAPLGWIDAQGEGEFVVGIRSALLEPSRLCLFAGAGIVKDSDPEREIAEVHLKLGALLQALTADRRSDGP